MYFVLECICMKENIVIVGMNYEYNIEIAQMISSLTDLYFLDVKQFVDYQLFDKKNMEQICGIEYMQKQENKAIQSCVEYENTVMTIPIEYFLRKNQYENFSKFCVVYISFSKDKISKLYKTNKDMSMLFSTLITFEEKDEQLQKIANLTINVKNKGKNNIMKEILHFVEREYEHK